jgi:hypothetical protein
VTDVPNTVLPVRDASKDSAGRLETFDREIPSLEHLRYASLAY